jgi:hypothetical protein
MRFATRAVGALVLIMAGTTAFTPGQQKTASIRPSEPLKAFLRSYLNHEEDPDITTKINVVNVKTNGGKNEEFLVYISGQRWCGSGGCTMLILESDKSSFTILGRVTIVRLPIRILSSMNNGHPDIGVQVSEGGIQPDYEAVLSFDGEAYPENPSIPPARKVRGVRGKVIIATTGGSVPLYN